MNRRLAMALLLVAGAAAGCSWAPARPDERAPAGTNWARWGAAPSAAVEQGPSGPLQGGAVVDLATRMIGSPYRWGGATPEGFDCSGLVYYAFGEAGIKVPRTSQEQYQAARPVPVSSARPGDLVFFGQGGRISHVGIYIGDQRFIHSPEAGQSVKISALSEAYFSARFAGSGRFE